MKNWFTSAVIYLLVVVAVYNIYDTILKDSENNESNEIEHSEHAETDSIHVDSDVTADVKVSGEKLKITLTDNKGNFVEELDLNHEKYLHLIVVDHHLEQYYHLHPDQIDVGIFQTTLDIPSGSYKAFVDIKPVDLSYHVTPLSFNVGETEEEHVSTQLTPDPNFTKTIDDYTVTMNPSSLKASEPLTLEFEIPDVTLEPYLGAMGHVVILDESTENFIHVHPVNSAEPIFETQFDRPGRYKIWAEFKIEGNVTVFPYVIEVN